MKISQKVKSFTLTPLCPDNLALHTPIQYIVKEYGSRILEHRYNTPLMKIYNIETMDIQRQRN